MSETKSIQEEFLDRVRREGQTVTVITTNGFQMTGRILGYDRFALLVEEERGGRQNLVYKSAVSTITRAQGGEGRRERG